ncbi:hypothetical protein [Pseudoalteromonas sp. PA2MD11]|uniref:hypothetical protein n=1 Tax=Pseudoalteromonas sp. PA2MD11 TaxID=2785057 RepID=UPI001ADF9D26|nr:hypothetical protein [Pseudoalteromonas sp. PA2MD11]
MHVNFRSSSEFKNITLAWAKNSKGIKVCRLRESIANVAGFPDLKSYLTHLDFDKGFQPTKEKFEEKLYCNGRNFENSQVFERSVTIQVSQEIKDLSVIKSIPPQIKPLNHPSNEALVLISEVLGCNLKAIKKLDIDEHLFEDEELSDVESCEWSALYDCVCTDKDGYAVEVLRFDKVGSKYNIVFNLDVTTTQHLGDNFDLDPVLLDTITNSRLRLDDYQLFKFISNYVTNFLSLNPEPFVEEPTVGYFFKKSIEKEFNELFFNEIVTNMPASTITKFPLVNWGEGSELSQEVVNIYHLTNLLINNIAEYPTKNINHLMLFLEAIDYLPFDPWERMHIMFSDVKGELIER